MHTYQISYKGNSKKILAYTPQQAIKIGLMAWRVHHPQAEDIQVKLIK